MPSPRTPCGNIPRGGDGTLVGAPSSLQLSIMGRLYCSKDGGISGAHFKQMSSFESLSGRCRPYDDFTMPRNTCVPATAKRKSSFSKGTSFSVKLTCLTYSRRNAASVLSSLFSVGLFITIPWHKEVFRRSFT